MLALLGFIKSVIGMYIWVVIISAILSWLVAFGVINPYNNFVRTVQQMLYAVTEPVLRPIRRFMPDLGGIDISPVIMILGLIFLRDVAIGSCASGFIAPLVCRA